MIVILYHFVSGFMAKRLPHRSDHLSYIGGFVDSGKVLAGGALPETLSKGLILFRGTVEEAQDFVSRDPYVVAGVVADHEIGEWSIVVGDRFEGRGG